MAELLRAPSGPEGPRQKHRRPDPRFSTSRLRSPAGAPRLPAAALFAPALFAPALFATVLLATVLFATVLGPAPGVLPSAGASPVSPLAAPRTPLAVAPTGKGAPAGAVAGTLAGTLAGAVAPAPNNSSLPPGSTECRANRAAGTLKFASPFGYDASAGIIDVYAALKLGYFTQLCLDVQFINAPPGQAYPLVSAGTAQLTGEGSAADAMVAEADGSNFVGISTFADTSDYAIITRKSITNLRQLQGKVLGYHAVLPVVLREMLVKAGAQVSKIKLVNDTTYDPLLLVHGNYFGLQAYQSNEPVTLRAAHEPFNLWLPSQFGVQGTFNVQVVNRDFLAAHRSSVADFLRAELEAFSFCSGHAAQCVSYLAKASNFTFDSTHALAEWAIESNLVKDHHLSGRGNGVETQAEWAPEAAALLRYGLVKKPVHLAAAEDTSLCASLYDGQRLIWP